MAGEVCERLAGQMTTIVATRYLMAADTKTIVGESWFYGHKMTRIGKAVVGCAGDSTAIEKFLAWYRKPRGKRPDLQCVARNAKAGA